MSEEKKDIGSDAASKLASTTEAGRDKTAMNEGSKLSDNASRPRNQDILPGILGKQLKAAYGELLNSPVPDAITDLINQLKSKEAEAAAASDKPRAEEDGQ
jgi:hypothetical protein